MQWCWDLPFGCQMQIGILSPTTMRNGDSKTTSSTTCVESPGSSKRFLLPQISLDIPATANKSLWKARSGSAMLTGMKKRSRILFTQLCSPPWRTTSWWVKPGRLESLHSRRRTTLLRTTNHLDISSWERLKNICVYICTSIWQISSVNIAIVHLWSPEGILRMSGNIWKHLRVSIGHQRTCENQS